MPVSAFLSFMWNNLYIMHDDGVAGTFIYYGLPDIHLCSSLAIVHFA